MEYMLYSFLRFYFKLLFSIYFKEIKVYGKGNVPLDKPVLLYGNHSNALLDPVMLVCALEKHVVLTATSTLGSRPVVGNLLRRLHVLLIHRRVDGHSESSMTKNRNTLEVSADRIHQNEILLIFPEGRSYPGQEMFEFKSGSARIIQNYHQKYGKDLHVQPACIRYKKKGRFRSTIQISFLPRFDKFPEHNREFVAETTNSMKQVIKKEQERLQAVSRNPSSKISNFTNLIYFALFIFPSILIIIPLTFLIAQKDEQIDSVRILISFILLPLLFLIPFFVFGISTVLIVTLLSLIIFLIIKLNLVWKSDISPEVVL